MLKIKDEVDLKELEKFGFIENEISTYEVKRYIDGKLVYRLFVEPGKRCISLEIHNSAIIVEGLQKELYGLFKAGIVEEIAGE